MPFQQVVTGKGSPAAHLAVEKLLCAPVCANMWPSESLKTHRSYTLRACKGSLSQKLELECSIRRLNGMYLMMHVHQIMQTGDYMQKLSQGSPVFLTKQTSPFFSVSV